MFDQEIDKVLNSSFFTLNKNSDEANKCKEILTRGLNDISTNQVVFKGVLSSMLSILISKSEFPEHPSHYGPFDIGLSNMYTDAALKAFFNTLEVVIMGQLDKQILDYYSVVEKVCNEISNSNHFNTQYMYLLGIQATKLSDNYHPEKIQLSRTLGKLSRKFRPLNNEYFPNEDLKKLIKGRNKTAHSCAYHNLEKSDTFFSEVSREKQQVITQDRVNQVEHHAQIANNYLRFAISLLILND